MDNNFNNENNDNQNLYSGFESPSADNPLNLEFEEPYVQSNVTSTAAENLATVKPKKTRKWLVPTLAGLGVAIVACVCCVLFIPQVNNFFKLNTQDPTSYYQDVEKDTIKNSIEENADNIKGMTAALSQVTGELAAASDINTLYANLSENAAAFTGIKLTVNDGFKDFVKAYMDTDGGVASELSTELFNSFNSISIDGVTMANDKQQMSMDLSIALNETTIISANMILDLKNYTVYFAIPEVTDTTFKIQIPERVIAEYKDDLAEDMALLDQVYGLLDESVKYLEDNHDEFLEFIEKYSVIIIESFEDAELSKNVEVEVNDVVVEYTEIVIKIDEKMANTAAKNVLEALKDDDFAKGFIAAIEISEEEYDKTIADALKEIEEADLDDEGSKETIDLYTYVNNKGEVVGRGLGAEGDLITYVTYEKDDETQFQLNIKATSENNPGKMVLRGKSEGEDAKSGYVIFEFVNDEYDFNVKCDFKDAKLENADLGLYSGTFTFTSTFPELEPFEFILDLEATDKSQTITMDLLYNDAKTITYELSAGLKEYKEIKIPDNALVITENVTPQELLPTLRKLNLTTVKDNLKKALNSEKLNSVVDAAFAEYGLDVVDGDMTDAELEQLFKTLSEATGSKEEVLYEDVELYPEDDDDLLTEENDEKTGDDGDGSKFMDAYLNGLE